MALDTNAEERRNIRILLRWVSGFLAFPSLTIAVAFLLWDPAAHALHAGGLMVVGLAAVLLWVCSARIALRAYPPVLIDAA